MLSPARSPTIFVPGPLHMFRAGGMYFAYELAREHDLVMVVQSDYRDDPTFRKFLAAVRCLDVEYMPVQLGIVARHKYYRRILKALAERHRPKFVIQHNNNYLWNMYLFHFARKAVPDCLRIAYLTTQGFIDPAPFIRLATIEQIDMTARRYRLPRRLARPVFHVRSWLAFAINHGLLPWLYIGRTLMPRANYLTAAIQWPHREQNLDVYFVTHPLYRAWILGENPERVSVDVVAHPATVVGRELHERLYGPVGDREAIAVLPTNAFALRKMRDENWSEARVIEHFSTLWTDALRRLMRRLPKCRVTWKAHPSSANDPLMVAILREVKKSIPILDVRPIDESAEVLTLRSRIVVSDVSSILYWARMVGDIVPISLDIFGVKGGDEMRRYDGIAHIDDPSQLDTLELDWARHAKNVGDPLPTFSSALRNRLTRHRKRLSSSGNLLLTSQE